MVSDLPRITGAPSRPPSLVALVCVSCSSAARAPLSVTTVLLAETWGRTRQPSSRHHELLG